MNELEVIKSIPVFELDTLMVLTLGTLSFFLGLAIKARFVILQKLSFPVPYLGGLPVALLCWFLQEAHIVEIIFTPEVAQISLKFFMCCLALFGSWNLLKTSIFFVVVFWILATFLSILQSSLGIVLSSIFDLDPAYGILVGAISLMGGFETYTNFIDTFSILGITNAEEIALGTKTFGVLAALTLGAPMGEYLIHRYRLHVAEYPESNNRLLEIFLSEHPKPFYQYLSKEVLKIVALVGLSVLLGDLITKLLSEWMVIPSYVAGMIVAILFRLYFDAETSCFIEGVALRTMTKATLTLVIVTNTCALPLKSLTYLNWEIYFILFLQLILNLFFAWFAYFKLLGRNYETMMLAIGGIGFSIGITPNGLSNMQSLCEKYGPCMRIIFIVAVVGVILISITNMLIVDWMLSFLSVKKVF